MSRSSQGGNVGFPTAPTGTEVIQVNVIVNPDATVGQKLELQREIVASLEASGHEVKSITLYTVWE